MKKNDDIKDRLVTISASIVIFAIIVDVMLSMSIDVLEKQLVSMYGVILFIGITAAIYIPSQYLLLRFVNNASKDIRVKSSYFGIAYRAVVFSQYVIAGIMLITVLQIVLTGKYSVGLLIAATVISFTLATIIMVMFSYRFFSWFKSSTYQKTKKNYTTLALLLFYGIAGSAAAISIGAHDIAFNSIMLNELSNSSLPSSSLGIIGREIMPQTDIKFSEISINSLGTITGSFYIMGLVILMPAFILAWAGSAVLLKNYSHRLGQFKFWIVISVPLVLYIITVIPTVLNPSGKVTYYEEAFISLRLINKLTVIAGSILFGVAFLAIGRTMQEQKQVTSQDNDSNISIDSNSIKYVKYYMLISAYGVMTFANLVATPVHHSTWPPFGLAASSFVSTAAFLLSLGFYSSAVSVSHDTRLRRLIRQYVKDHQQHMKFLDNIGTAQGEQEIQKRVLETLKHSSDIMEQDSGVQSSMTDNEMKVLKEIKTEGPTS
jgi:hypothetical protein